MATVLSRHKKFRVQARLGALILTILMAFSIGTKADMVITDDYEPWEVCALCHSLSGDSVMAKFPKLNGQKPAYLSKQIRDFQHGRRLNDGGQMSEMVAEVEDIDVDAIVVWFSSQKHPEPSELDLADEDLSLAKTIYMNGKENIPACVQCHNATNDTIPWIQSQHAAYIEKQLLDFKATDRENDKGVMTKIAKQLSADEVQALSKYISSAIRAN